MTVEEAAQEVENYLLEEALKVQRINKIQQRLKTAAPSAPAAKQTPQPQTQQQTQPRETKTLSNSMGTQGRLSARERAMLAFEGKLKQ
jgi:hypothetical protein